MNEFRVWTSQDQHSRAFATLTTARSARLGEALGVRDPARNVHGVVCHAPMEEVPRERRAPAADALQGVSCESCHNAAEPWLRSHVREDFSHAQRVLAGMREVATASGRANTCVACHQTIAPELLRAGHPVLIFELDGQCASQPRHWDREDDPPGPKLWLAGQAAALREMSSQLLRVTNAEPRQVEAWQGLAWLLKSVVSDGQASFGIEPSLENFQAAHVFGRDWVNKVSSEAWDDGKTRSLLERTMKTGPDFRDLAVPRSVQVRRAERLVLAVDRLAASLQNHGVAEERVTELFAAVQDQLEFSPHAFAALLEGAR